MRRLAKVALLIAPIAALMGACSANPTDTLPPGGNTCTAVTPRTGCPCEPASSVLCGDVLQRSADSVTCSMGTRSCGANGKWGGCVGDHITQQSVGTIDLGGFHTEGLGASQPCQDDPCNPGCVAYTDNGTGIGLTDGGIVGTEAGLQLAPTDGSTDSGACKNLQCQIASCGGNVTTTLTGTVYDPAGLNPLYNAAVYVPNSPVPPITQGMTCDQCSGVTAATSAAYTTTGPDGKFKLTNVPVGNAIPLVIQIGKWRRQTTVNVPSCATTAVPAAQTRLPKNQSEGDMPQMAIATGSADPFECLLLGIGIDPNEFTLSNKSGRVHYYVDNGVKLKTANIAASTLESSLPTLEKYDIVFLPCEGFEDDKPTATTTAMQQYADAGGRVFTTHYGYAWLQHGPNPWPGVASWTGHGTNPSDPLTGFVDTSFPKGAAYAQWLTNVGGSAKPGQLTINESRWDVTAALGSVQRWVYGWHNNKVTANPDTIQHMTFNTPYSAKPANQCGRVVYSDFHVSANALSGQANFPQSCLTGALSAQEKALEFMVFDLSSCITPDTSPPPAAPPYTKSAVYTRDYQSTCPVGKKVVWHFFDYMTSTPKDSSIVFSAATSAAQSGLGSALAVQLAKVTGPDITFWTGVDVDPKLQTINQTSKDWLRITMTLNPSTDGYATPTIANWRQLFDCVDAL